MPQILYIELTLYNFKYMPITVSQIQVNCPYTGYLAVYHTPHTLQLANNAQLMIRL